MLDPSADLKPIANQPVSLNTAKPERWENVFIGGAGTVRSIKVHPVDGTVALGADVSGIFYWDVSPWPRPADPVVPTYGLPEQPWEMHTVGWRATMDAFGREAQGLIHTDQFAFDPTNADTLYFVGGQQWLPGSGVLVTRDRGRTWIKVPLNRPDGKRVFVNNASTGERVKVCPWNTQVIYYGSRRDGLYRSTDAGATWRVVENFPDTATKFHEVGAAWIQFAQVGERQLTIVAAQPSGKDAKFERGIFISEDEGHTWQRTDWPHANLGIVDAQGRFLYTSSKKVMKTDLVSGQSVEITPMELGKNPGWDYSPVAVSHENPDWLVVFTREYGQGCFFRSKDGGKSWQKFHNDDWKGSQRTFRYEPQPYYPSLGGEAHPFNGVWDVTFDSQEKSRLWIGYWPGVLMSPDAWADEPVFRNMGEGHEEVCLFDMISPTEGALLISGMMDVGGFVHERLDLPPRQGMVGVAPEGPHGQVTPLEVTSLDFCEANPNVIVAGVCWRYTPPPDGFGTGHARYSSDGGKTWRKFPAVPVAGAKDGRVAIAAKTSENVVWVPRLDNNIGVYFTTDMGQSWRRSKGAPAGLIWPDLVFSFYKPLAADRVHDGWFYLYDKRDGRFYRSEDGGASFRHASRLPAQGQSHTVYHRIVAVPGMAGHVWAALDDKGLFMSPDGGDHWTQLQGVEQAVDVAFGLPLEPDQPPAVYTLGRIQGETNPAFSVYRSADLGRTWTRIDDADTGWATAVTLTASRQTPGRVFVGTNGRGIIYNRYP